MRMLCTAILLVSAATAAQAETQSHFRGKAAYCYFDRETTTWRLGNDVIERTIRFDPSAGGLFTQKFIHKPAGSATVVPVSTLEGEVTLADADAPTVKTTLRLDSDWAFSWQTVSTPAHGGRLLTVHMFGVGRNKGFELESLYEVWPGNRPFIGRSINLINHSDTARRVQRIQFDRWVLTPATSAAPAKPRPDKTALAAAAGPQPKTALPLEFRTVEQGVCTLVEPGFGHGLVAAVWAGTSDISWDKGSVLLAVRTDALLKGRAGRFFGPKVTIAPYQGDSAGGYALWKRFYGEQQPQTVAR
jgi:hypothetical protein